jgi:uncharacterized protein
MEDGHVDLELLGLGSGQAVALRLPLTPRAPVIGGVELEIDGGEVGTRVDVSKTISGFALRLTATAMIRGSCVRCLEAAALEVEIDAREIEQIGAADPDLTSPYVAEGLLDAAGWLADALTLALPEKLLCRPDCAGLCEQCGVSLNDIGPEGHGHERPLDPRFAKLRELEGGR